MNARHPFILPLWMYLNDCIVCQPYRRHSLNDVLVGALTKYGGRGRSRTHIFHVNKNNNLECCIHVLKPQHVAEDVANAKIQVGRGR